MKYKKLPFQDLTPSLCQVCASLCDPKSVYIEKMGTGISKIRKLMKEEKLSPPKFAFNTFFTVTFKRPYKKEKKIEVPGAALYEVLDRFIREPINEPIGEPVKKRLLNELAYIKQHGFITTGMVENLNKISTRSAK